MTEASVTRLEKRNKKKHEQNQSGAKTLDVVETARLNAMKPYIQQQIALSGQQIMQGVHQFIMQERAAIQTRQLAFERILARVLPGFNEEALAMEVAAVEDESQGLAAVDAGTEVKQLDKVRCTFTAMPHGKEEWMPESRLCIHAVGSKGPNGTVQTHEALEAALEGMRIGDTKEFSVDEPVGEGEAARQTKCRVKVVLISRVKEA